MKEKFRMHRGKCLLAIGLALFVAVTTTIGGNYASLVKAESSSEESTGHKVTIFYGYGVTPATSSDNIAASVFASDLNDYAYNGTAKTGFTDGDFADSTGKSMTARYGHTNPAAITSMDVIYGNLMYRYSAYSSGMLYVSSDKTELTTSGGTKLINLGGAWTKGKQIYVRFHNITDDLTIVFHYSDEVTLQVNAGEGASYTSDFPGYSATNESNTFVGYSRPRTIDGGFDTAITYPEDQTVDSVSLMIGSKLLTVSADQLASGFYVNSSYEVIEGTPDSTDTVICSYAPSKESAEPEEGAGEETASEETASEETTPEETDGAASAALDAGLAELATELPAEVDPEEETNEQQGTLTVYKIQENISFNVNYVGGEQPKYITVIGAENNNGNPIAGSQITTYVSENGGNADFANGIIKLDKAYEHNTTGLGLSVYASYGTVSEILVSMGEHTWTLGKDAVTNGYTSFLNQEYVEEVRKKQVSSDIMKYAHSLDSTTYSFRFYEVTEDITITVRYETVEAEIVDEKGYFTSSSYNLPSVDSEASVSGSILTCSSRYLQRGNKDSDTYSYRAAMNPSSSSVAGIYITDESGTYGKVLLQADARATNPIYTIDGVGIIKFAYTGGIYYARVRSQTADKILFQPAIYGDLNQDLEVTDEDLTQLRKILAGLRENTMLADYDQSESIDVKDIVRMKKYVNH